MAERIAVVRDSQTRAAHWSGLPVSMPTDEHEREADRLADAIVGNPAAPVAGSVESTPGAAINRQAEEAHEDEQAPADRPDHEPEEEDQPEGLEPDGMILPSRLQGASAAGRLASGHLASGGGQPLPMYVRSQLEPRFGHDFSTVRVHSDDRAAAAARSISAAAFTHGHDIYFGAGRFDPAQPAGLRLLAHELTHVVQRRGGDAGALHRSALSRPAIHAAPAGGPAVLRAIEAHINLAVPQHVRIYKDKTQKDYLTSTGAGNSTSRYAGKPLKVIGKRADPTAIVGKWGLQYFSWFTKGGVGFHSNICFPRAKNRKRTVLVVNGNPLSHGCARLSHADSIEVYGALSTGVSVFIYKRKDGFAPASWTHQKDAKSASSGPGGKTSGRTHKVSEGETLSGIARLYGVNADDIAEANAITDPHKIKAGQILAIPRTGEGIFSDTADQ